MPDTGWTVTGRPAYTEEAVSIAATAQVHVLAASKTRESRLGCEPGPEHKATCGRGPTMLAPFHVIARFCSSGVDRSVQNAFGLSVPGSYSSLRRADSDLRSGGWQIRQASKATHLLLLNTSRSPSPNAPDVLSMHIAVCQEALHVPPHCQPPKTCYSHWVVHLPEHERSHHQRLAEGPHTQGRQLTSIVEVANDAAKLLHVQTIVEHLDLCARGFVLPERMSMATIAHLIGTTMAFLERQHVMRLPTLHNDCNLTAYVPPSASSSCRHTLPYPLVPAKPGCSPSSVAPVTAGAIVLPPLRVPRR